MPPRERGILLDSRRILRGFGEGNAGGSDDGYSERYSFGYDEALLCLEDKRDALSGILHGVWIDVKRRIDMIPKKRLLLGRC